MARFSDVDGGAIRLGGVDVREVDPAELMASFALVFQEPFLFSDTVAANLRVARPDATDAELRAACRAARVDDLVDSLPEGLDTRLGVGGVQLSGGERQRLTIARAILADADVVLLDEATAMTDPDNEAAIQEAIGELVRGRTLVVVAHRLRTIAGADQIVVVEDGQVVERGRHAELMASGGTYARMWADMERAEGMGVSGGEGSR